jgi:hypothetical protein
VVKEAIVWPVEEHVGQGHGGWAHRPEHVHAQVGPFGHTATVRGLVDGRQPLVARQVLVASGELVVEVGGAFAVADESQGADVLVVAAQLAVAIDGEQPVVLVGAGGGVDGEAEHRVAVHRQMISWSPVMAMARCGLLMTTTNGIPRAASGLSWRAASRICDRIGFRITSTPVVTNPVTMGSEEVSGANSFTSYTHC